MPAEIMAMLRATLEVLLEESVWVNPDRGLKTRVGVCGQRGAAPSVSTARIVGVRSRRDY